jgi:hypothetical protein
LVCVCVRACVCWELSEEIFSELLTG